MKSRRGESRYMWRAVPAPEATLTAPFGTTVMAVAIYTLYVHVIIMRLYLKYVNVSIYESGVIIAVATLYIQLLFRYPFRLFFFVFHFASRFVFHLMADLLLMGGCVKQTHLLPHSALEK